MNLTVTSSPHIRGDFRSSRMMLDVVIALIPSLIVGIVVLGIRALVVTLISMAAAVVAEYLWSLVLKRRNTIIDGSALVTGMLFALTLPSTIPYWIAAVGSAFAIIVAKLMCGGLGQNIFNPALSARGFMMLIAPAYMVRFEGLDGVTAATPLHHMVMPALPEETVLDMFLGNCPGSIGEVSALALLVGGVWLVYRRVISLRIPVAYGMAYLTASEAWPNGHPFSLSTSLLVAWTMGAVITFIAYRKGKWRKTAHMTAE